MKTYNAHIGSATYKVRAYSKRDARLAASDQYRADNPGRQLPFARVEAADKDQRS